MNLVNLTNSQYQTVLRVFIEYLQRLINRVERRINQRLSPELVLQLILYMYRSRYSRESMQRLAISVINSGVRNYSLDLITNLLRGRNQLGFFLRQENVIEQPSYIVSTNKISLIYDQNIYKLLTQKFFNIQWSIVLDQKINQQQMKFNIKSSKFMRRYLEYAKYKWCVQLVKEQKVDKEFVDKECKTLQEQEVTSYRKQAIVQLYNQQLDEDDVQQKYKCYMLIQYLFTISDKQFTDEFEVKNEGYINMLVIFIIYNDVHNLFKLKMKANIVKHVESSRIYFEFSNNFKLEDIPDDVIISMLDNVENRLQIIGGYEYVIIRRISDNKIMKCMVTDNNQQQIENILQQCNDGNVYDVIISSYNEYENVKNIRMRYLNCNGPPYKLTLNHPEDLVSLSTSWTKISNMNQCIKLRNLCSKRNTYNRDDIAPLKNLRRIYSYWDEYEENGNCLLQELFENNKLEYMYVYNGYFDSNIVKSFVIRDNIENLRYIDVYYYGKVYDIKLNVNQTTPENLHVFDVDTEKDRIHKYGTIEGEEGKVEQIKKRLICELQQND